MSKMTSYRVKRIRRETFEIQWNFDEFIGGDVELDVSSV